MSLSKTITFFKEQKMRGETRKILGGFILGVLVVFLLGATHTTQKHEDALSGAISTSTVAYQSVLSGITPDGLCYLAVTNTQTGYTDIFRIDKDTSGFFGKHALQAGHQGRVVAIPQH